MGNTQEKVDEAIVTIEENCGSLSGIKKSIIPLIPLHILQTKVTPISLNEHWLSIPKRKRVNLREYLP